MNTLLWTRCFGCTAFTVGALLGLQMTSFAAVDGSMGEEHNFSKAELLIISSDLELNGSIHEAVLLSNYTPPRHGNGSGAPQEGHGSGTR